MFLKHLFLVLPVLLISCAATLRQGEEHKLHSQYTKDDYLITFKKPANFDNRNDYHLVFVADGSIGLGQYVLGTDPKWKANIPDNCVIVAISHTGDWAKKRQKDFIPSDAGGYNSEELGHAEKFYSFLKFELIPFVETKIRNGIDRSFIGHSFSGLFCLYAALKNEKLFDHYFAISPSVWANKNELLKIEENYSKTHKDLNADIHIYAGGLEIFNKVLSSSKKFYSRINERGYKNLRTSFKEIRNANHYSIRKPAVDSILEIVAKG